MPMRRRFSEESGQAAVELALILPVLAFMLLSIMEGGRIFAGYIELQNAARDGVRYASIKCSKAQVPDSQLATWVAAELTPWVESRLNMLKTGDLTLEFSRKSSDNAEVWVEVVLTCKMKINTPVLSSLIGNPLNLRVVMAMRNE